MSKCYQCNTEFSGLTCPHCGATYKNCPSCHALLPSQAIKCHLCGYSFVDVTKRSLAKIWKLSTWISLLFSALFTILLFAFYAAPIAEIPLGDLGEMLAGQNALNLFNVYQLLLPSALPEEAAMLSGLNGFAIGAILIVIPMVFFALLGIYACACQRNALANFIHTVFLLFSVILMIAASVLIAQINAFDGEADLLSVGACPILVLVFSIICLVTNFATLCGKNYVAQKNLGEYASK